MEIFTAIGEILKWIWETIEEAAKRGWEIFKELISPLGDVFWYIVGVFYEAPNTKENGPKGYLVLIPAFLILGVIIWLIIRIFLK